LEFFESKVEGEFRVRIDKNGTDKIKAGNQIENLYDMAKKSF
jgi:hypothetical protein